MGLGISVTVGLMIVGSLGLIYSTIIKAEYDVIKETFIREHNHEPGEM